MRLLLCALALLGPVLATSPQKVIYNIPEKNESELEGHSFLKFVTPSDRIYHFTDDRTLVLERTEDGEKRSTILPFITFGPPHGSKYYIHFPANETGFKLYVGTDTSGKDAVEGEIKIRSFAGPNRERYLINYYNLPIVRDIARVEDDIVNYLQLVFEYNSQVYAFTFSENGDELTKKKNCTDSTFLTLAFPNGKVHKIKQSSHAREKKTVEDELVEDKSVEDKPVENVASSMPHIRVDDVSLLPYISFYHVDGAKYDIRFPKNATPTIERDMGIDREPCAASFLRRFTGPDGKLYTFEVKDYQPIITPSSTEEASNKTILHFYNSIGQTMYHEYSNDGELIGLSGASSAFAVQDHPGAPFDVKNVEFSCIQNCD